MYAATETKKLRPPSFFNSKSIMQQLTEAFPTKRDMSWEVFFKPLPIGSMGLVYLPTWMVDYNHLEEKIQATKLLSYPALVQYKKVHSKTSFPKRAVFHWSMISGVSNENHDRCRIFSATFSPLFAPSFQPPCAWEGVFCCAKERDLWRCLKGMFSCEELFFDDFRM